MPTPIIATMIGDPSGIGPEICAKAIVDAGQAAGRVLLIGSADAVRQAVDVGTLPLTVHAMTDVSQAVFESGRVNVLDPGSLTIEQIPTGVASAACGKAVGEWIELADTLVASGEAAAAIMAPVNSDALKAAGVVRSIDELQPPDTSLLRISDNLRVLAMSEHLPLREVPQSVTRQRLERLLELLDRSLRSWGIESARIAVAGLNPHASGEEEQEHITPAITAMRAAGLDVTGPISPDAVFRQCVDGQYDVVVSMYHDQGQIPLKTVAFHGACTIYLGLPTLRMSIPQGTAYDIAGKGVADPSSMRAAMTVAARLSAGQGFR